METRGRGSRAEVGRMTYAEWWWKNLHEYLDNLGLVIVTKHVPDGKGLSAMQKLGRDSERDSAPIGSPKVGQDPSG